MELLGIFVAGASLFGCATLLVMMNLRSSMSDQPRHWKVVSDGYGVSLQFQFGRSIGPYSFGCSGACFIQAQQRNNFGPLYYKRYVEGGAISRGLSTDRNAEPWVGDPFAELR